MKMKKRHLHPIRWVVAGWLLACLLPMTLLAQSRVITGQVTDGASGEPLPGVSIRIKGTTRGTTTGIDGEFNVSVVSTDTLVFSFVGFQTVERVVGPASIINIGLEPDMAQLDELVVIGYGTTTTRDATGSLTSVTPEDFNQGNIVTPENQLNGRVAGLTVNTGGQPGAGSVIRIRGGASLGASNDPLIIINGLPIDNNSVGGSRSILSSLNPNDIASFTVLKDASATAIYGSRASNGVILITTKTAQGKLRVNIDLQTGFNTSVGTLDVYDADGFRNVLATQRPGLDTTTLGNANTDWQEAVLRDRALNSTVNISAQGVANLGGFKLPIRASGGYSYQEGLILTSEFERLTGSVSMTPTLLNGDLKLEVNLNYSQENNRFADEGQLRSAIRFDPTQPVRDTLSPFGGYFQYYNPEAAGQDIADLDQGDLIPNAPFNPVAQLEQTNNISEVSRFFGNFKVDYNLPFLPEITAVVNAGWDIQRSDSSNTIQTDNPVSQPDSLSDVNQFRGAFSEYENEQDNLLLDMYFRYNKDLDVGAKILNLEATAGYSYQRFESEQFNTGETRNITNDTVFSRQTDLVLIGFFARTNLTFDDKYVLTLAYRRDGTSRFSEDNRWGNFPSAAVAWKFSEEFFPDSRLFSTMKFRVGWGVTGQQDIGRDNTDLFRSRYFTSQGANSFYQFGDQTITAGQPQFRNEDLKWEETTTWNFGIDYGILDDRFTGSIEYFHKRSEDLLAFAAIAEGSNFSNAGFQNIGTFVSQGLEFAINADIVTSESPRGFNWNLNYNLTIVRTEIEELALGQDELVGGISGGTGNTIQVHREGFTPFSFFPFKQIYDENGRPIEGAYADLNGDNIINDADRYIHKNNQPDATMGLLSNMSYKGFDLSFNLRLVVGNYVYNNVASSNAQYDLLQNVNVLANIPTAVEETDFNTTEDVILSDHYIENASFLRMDNITLGYTFRDLLRKESSLRISAGVQNVFVITEYSGLDPEVFGNGIDNTIFPRPRTYFLGANISF